MLQDHDAAGMLKIDTALTNEGVSHVTIQIQNMSDGSGGLVVKLGQGTHRCTEDEERPRDNGGIVELVSQSPVRATVSAGLPRTYFRSKASRGQARDAANNDRASGI